MSDLRDEKHNGEEHVRVYEKTQNYALQYFKTNYCKYSYDSNGI